MLHLTTRAPAHVSFVAVPSPIAGFIATARNELTGATAEAWAESEAQSRMRAEYLLELAE